MGEDITKLKKNIEAIKTIMQGGKKNETKQAPQEKVSDTKR